MVTTNHQNNCPHLTQREVLGPIVYHLRYFSLRLSLDSAEEPSDWHRGNVLPVFKKGLHTDPLNYRPISLTSITSKRFEHVISHDLHRFLETKSLLANCQHGFRRQLLTTISRFIDSYDQDISLYFAVLDYSKAYDAVFHA